MDAPQPQRSGTPADSTRDYITNLPANIKENILLKLPIKDAVRTTILSRKWIDLWVSIPDLVFQQNNCTESELIKMVDMVFLSHQGPIQKFKLESSHACNEAISRWLIILSRNGIEDLQLEFRHICKISFRLISCNVLERLCLSFCSINIPSFFQGYDLLRTLILTHCSVSGISIENVVSSCPLLDHLKLHGVHQGCLSICASNLTCLEISDLFHDIRLETPKLASASIYLAPNRANHQKFSVARDRNESNIIRALGRLLSIQKLEIDGVFIQKFLISLLCLQVLGRWTYPENLPAVFNHLTDISSNLYVKPNEISAALCLFKNAPNLEELYIKFNTIYQPNVDSWWGSTAIDALWGSTAMEDCLFKHLKVVKIEYYYRMDFWFKSTRSVLEFTRLVLRTAPVLEKLNFIEVKAATVIFEMLKWYPKLSKNAEIAFV